ncbi:tetratricopeptide repeat protein [Flavobacterium sp. PLA-1-15]|uniref:tetratricopeptide repeat protein n=1 Tax=Flavobacterium sp. PLA-1-15 TaxID=3380533 RepID=UPI003B7A9792
MKKLVLLIIFGILLSNPISVFAQAEPEAIGLETDEFQELFFEALKQKGIENYDRAIVALEKCLKLQPENANVYNELGKNYLKIKDYKNAYDSFEKATKIDPKNKWFWNGMYDVCYQTQDYNQSIIIVTKLIEFDKGYKEDLVSLYMYTQQFDKALALINELNENVGKSEKRNNYKLQILQQAKYQGSEKENLVELIKNHPKEEANYISLIYLYSTSNEEEKALEVAKQLEKEIPQSAWAQVSLFKFHLNNNDGDKAVISMNKVLDSDEVDSKIKHRILNEFLIFATKNPKYEPALEKAIAYFENEKEVDVAKEIGKFYQNKKDWNKAIKYYEMEESVNPTNLENTMLLFQAYAENQQFKELSKKAENMMELFPSKPEFYYYAGLANNQLKNFKKAKDILETGIDYLVENKAMEINFNIQLGEAYNGLGDMKKKETYFLKADTLLKK